MKKKKIKITMEDINKWFEVDEPDTLKEMVKVLSDIRYTQNLIIERQEKKNDRLKEKMELAQKEAEYYKKIFLIANEQWNNAVLLNRELVKQYQQGGN